MSDAPTHTAARAVLQLDLPDEAATARLARCLGPALQAGDAVLLNGDLGSGKTFFARALIQDRLAATGHVEDVPSPSFTLVQTYDLGSVDLWHVDLYRLSGPDEIYELGLDQAFETAICLIEWPDRLGGLRPPGAVDLTLTDAGPTRRRAVLHLPETPCGDRIRTALSQAAGADD